MRELEYSEKVRLGETPPMATKVMLVYALLRVKRLLASRRNTKFTVKTSFPSLTTLCLVFEAH